MSNLFKGAALFVGGALVGAAAVVLLSAKTDGQVQNDLSDLLAGVKKRVKECYNQVKTDLDESQAEAAAKTQAEANGQSDKQRND